MSLHPPRILRKRDGYSSPSGSVVESNPSPTASLLAQNSAAVADSNSTPTGVPLVDPSASGSSIAITPSPTPTASGNSASSGNQISLGTVIGACVAALIALVFAVLLAFYCSRCHNRSTTRSKSRNVAGNISRRRSHLEPWKRMNDDAGQQEGTARPMTERPPSGSLGVMFHRTLSNASGEKSSDTHLRESVGTMHHFAKYHPGLAAEMASHGTIAVEHGNIVKPPLALHLVGRGSDMAAPNTWDGQTVGGESFASLHSSLSNSTSPVMMATAKSTPPATTSFLHRWESAEVVHVSPIGLPIVKDRERQNPFADSASSVKSSIKGQNPFFSGRDHPVRRPSHPGTPKNPFDDPETPRDSSAAIQSLIAALEDSTREHGDDRIVSVQSSVYSRMTGDDGDSAISVTAFPYPPTQINVR